MTARSADLPRDPAGLGALGATRMFWWGAFFLVWTLQVALYAGVTYYRRRATGDPLSLLEAIVASALDWYLWAAICLFCLWLATRFPLEQYRWRTLIPTFLAWGVLVTLARGVLDYGIVELLGWEQIPLAERLVATFPGRFILFVLFLGVGYAVEYARRHRHRELRAAHLRAELATAQLQMLKVQLHPHFLFNTLHAISSLMYTDVEAADRMLVRLSDLLRRTLQTMDAQRVTLADELSFLDPYLDIERTRLGRRLRVETDIAPEALDALVPHLILQPLVENAIRHGLAPKIEGGVLRIGSEISGGELVLTVSDDGVGLRPGSAEAFGVGLSNTRSRLEHLYGGSARLELTERREGGVLARVTLPLQMDSLDRADPGVPVGGGRGIPLNPSTDHSSHGSALPSRSPSRPGAVGSRL